MPTTKKKAVKKTAVQSKRSPSSSKKIAPKRKAPASSAPGKKRGKAVSALPSAEFYSYPLDKHADVLWHLARFRKLIKKFDAETSALIERAYVFAEKKHSSQTRLNGTPFIIHPIRIACILMEEWNEKDGAVIAAGLLHDVIEDTHTTIREVKDAFGDDVAKLTDGMTMWKGSESAEVYLQRIARGTVRLRQIKCADLLDNLRSWHEVPDEVGEKFPRWWRQDKTYGLPIAETTNRKAYDLFKKMLEDPWYLNRAKMA